MKYFISDSFTHGIGEYFEKETWIKLSSILQNGGLLSRNQLKKLNFSPVYGFGGKSMIQESDYVSLLDLSHDLVKRTILAGLAEFDLAYYEDVVTFIISPEIEKQESKRFAEMEVRIKDKVPLSYFKGMVVPDNKECQQKVFEILEKFGINLPVFNYDGERLDKNKINETGKEL